MLDSENEAEPMKDTVLYAFLKSSFLLKSPNLTRESVSLSVSFDLYDSLQ